MTPSIEIIYAAHTASCTFLLDSEGICRRIVMKPKGKRRDGSRTSVRCVGAQYVASLDGGAAGGLIEMPRVGAAMLFARVDERGRVSLVRTGAVTAFESKAGEDPFIESEAVETSAPDLLAPAVSREQGIRDPDYFDPSDRTQPVQALRPEQIAAALRNERNEPKTGEYHPADDEPPTMLISKEAPRTTLRNPHREAMIGDDDGYAEPPPVRPAPSSNGMLPRRSDPKLRAAAAYAYPPAPRPTPQPYASEVQISRRHRRG